MAIRPGSNLAHTSLFKQRTTFLARVWKMYEFKLGLLTFGLLIIDRVILPYPYYTFPTFVSLTGLRLLLVAPVTLLLINGKFDLSIWAIALGANYCYSAFIYNHISVFNAVLFTLGMTIAVGLINGISVSLLGIPSWLVTFAMGSLITGFTATWIYRIPGIQPPMDEGFAFVDINTLGFSKIILFSILFFFIFGLLIQNNSRLRYSLFPGQNKSLPFQPTSTHRRLVTFLLYLLSSLMAGICGIFYLDWMKISLRFAIPQDGLLILAACLIGGCSLWGRTGSLIGSFLGLILAEGASGILLKYLSRGNYYPGEEIYLILLPALLFTAWRYHRDKSIKKPAHRLPVV